MSEVEVYERADGTFGWRLRAGNGEIVASGEGHRDRTDAERAFKAAQRNMIDAEVPDPTAVEPEASE